VILSAHRVPPPCPRRRGTSVGRPTRVGEASAAQEIVELMTCLVADGPAALEQQAGLQAVEVAQDIESALMSAMEGKLANVVLWEQFLSTPSEVASVVVGVVRALIDADPVLAEWLEAALVRYKQACTQDL
jgi:hypothetical protein